MCMGWLRDACVSVWYVCVCVSLSLSLSLSLCELCIIYGTVPVNALPFHADFRFFEAGTLTEFAVKRVVEYKNKKKERKRKQRARKSHLINA